MIVAESVAAGIIAAERVAATAERVAAERLSAKRVAAKRVSAKQVAAERVVVRKTVRAEISVAGVTGRVTVNIRVTSTAIAAVVVGGACTPHHFLSCTSAYVSKKT